MCCTKLLHPPDQNICLVRSPDIESGPLLPTLHSFHCGFLKLDITPTAEWSSLTFSCERSAILGRLHHAETGAAYCNRTALFDFTEEGPWRPGGFVETTKNTPEHGCFSVPGNLCLILSVQRGDTKRQFLYNESRTLVQINGPECTFNSSPQVCSVGGAPVSPGHFPFCSHGGSVALLHHRKTTFLQSGALRL